jgi:hypothetical protein
MCNNWKRDDRKLDMTLEQVDREFRSDVWKKIAIANVSDGEPTTHHDLVDIGEVMVDRLPRLRKVLANAPGLAPKRAIRMIEKVAAARQRGG